MDFYIRMFEHILNTNIISQKLTKGAAKTLPIMAGKSYNIEMLMIVTINSNYDIVLFSLIVLITSSTNSKFSPPPHPLRT